MSYNGVCNICGISKPINSSAYCDKCSEEQSGKFLINFVSPDETIKAISEKIAMSWLDKLENDETLTISKIYKE